MWLFSGVHLCHHYAHWILYWSRRHKLLSYLFTTSVSQWNFCKIIVKAKHIPYFLDGKVRKKGRYRHWLCYFDLFKKNVLIIQAIGYPILETFPGSFKKKFHFSNCQYVFKLINGYTWVHTVSFFLHFFFFWQTVNLFWEIIFVNPEQLLYKKNESVNSFNTYTLNMHILTKIIFYISPVTLYPVIFSK